MAIFSETRIGGDGVFEISLFEHPRQGTTLGYGRLGQCQKAGQSSRHLPPAARHDKPGLSVVAGQTRKMGCLGGLFREYYEIWRKKGIYVALRELFRKTRAIPLNLKRPDGERRVTNFLHLAEVLHQANSSKSLSPSSLIVWLRTQMNQKGLSNEEYQLRLESQSESIRILTVHKSKGLEYPIVFLLGHSFLPSQKGDYISYHREDGQLVVDLKKTAADKAKSLAQKEESQEDAECFVALTLLFTVLRVSCTDCRKNSKLPAQIRMMRSWGLAAVKRIEHWISLIRSEPLG